MNVRRAILCLILAVLIGPAWFAQADDPPLAPATQPGDTAVDAEPAVPRAFVIKVEGVINDVRRDHIARGIELAKEQGANIVVLHLDTPGGLVSSAVDICGNIKQQTDLRTVAWVNPEAISAGAMIAVACDEIIVAERGKIGDCAPIMVGPDGMQSMGETERAKLNSYILEEFRDSADRNGYSEILCEAMVALGPAIYMLENTATGDAAFVTEEQLADYGLDKKGNPLRGSALARLLPGVDDEVKSNWKLVETVLEEGELLTMTQDEAIQYGFAPERKITTDAELMDYLGVSPENFTRIEPTWSENLVDFLTSPLVRGILTVVFLMGLYSEMNSPGLGLPGAAAVVAIVIMLGAPYLTGLASFVEIVLIMIGLGLIAVEIFILPGFGVPGVTGIILVFFGLMMTFVGAEPGPGFIPELPQTWDQIQTGMLTVALSFGVALIGFFFITRFYGTLPFVNRLVLTDAQSRGSGTPSSGTGASGDYEGVKVGDTGTTLGPLRPVGRARIGVEILDVVTNDEWLEPDTPVRVLEVHGNRIVVEEA